MPLACLAVASELGYLPHLQEPSLPVRVLSPSAGFSLVTALTLVGGVSLLMCQSTHYKSPKALPGKWKVFNNVCELSDSTEMMAEQLSF